VFESRAYSPAVQARWGIAEPLSTCEKGGGVAPLRLYRQSGETQSFRQVVFDDFVLDDETELRLELRAEEIDYDWRYGVFETTQAPYDDLGSGSILLSTVTPGTYTFRAGDWACVLTVSVFEYPFGELLGVPEPTSLGGAASLSLSPNPFSSSVRSTAPALAPAVADHPATLSIYDVSGRLLRRMTGTLGTGFLWDGRDEDGRSAPPGLYVHRLDAIEGTLYGRSLLVR
jgi:hypothetical protein